MTKILLILLAIAAAPPSQEVHWGWYTDGVLIALVETDTSGKTPVRRVIDKEFKQFDEILLIMARGWMTHFDYNDFQLLSRYWVPTEAAEPEMAVTAVEPETIELETTAELMSTVWMNETE